MEGWSRMTLRLEQDTASTLSKNICSLAYTLSLGRLDGGAVC